jgi:hypothetical protein
MNETSASAEGRARTCPSCGAPPYCPDREDVTRAPDAFDLDEARVGKVASRRPGARGVDGTFDDGRSPVPRHGRAVYVTRDGEPAKVGLPEGTPPPVGPIVWIP